MMRMVGRLVAGTVVVRSGGEEVVRAEKCESSGAHHHDGGADLEHLRGRADGEPAAVRASPPASALWLPPTRRYRVPVPPPGAAGM